MFLHYSLLFYTSVSFYTSVRLYTSVSVSTLQHIVLHLYVIRTHNYCVYKTTSNLNILFCLVVLVGCPHNTFPDIIHLSVHRRETASARYCSRFILKLLSVTFGHVSRRARQKMPPYHSMWSTPTIRISSVLLGHSSTTLSASHHHAWQSGHSPSTVRKRSAQVSADM